MKEENIKALENLSLFSHMGGLITLFLGMVIAFVDIVNGDFKHVQVGIFVFSTGYAFIKISSKISNILLSEKTPFSNQK